MEWDEIITQQAVKMQFDILLTPLSVASITYKENGHNVSYWYSSLKYNIMAVKLRNTPFFVKVLYSWNVLCYLRFYVSFNLFNKQDQKSLV